MSKIVSWPQSYKLFFQIHSSLPYFFFAIRYLWCLWCFYARAYIIYIIGVPRFFDLCGCKTLKASPLQQQMGKPSPDPSEEGRRPPAIHPLLGGGWGEGSLKVCPSNTSMGTLSGCFFVAYLHPQVLRTLRFFDKPSEQVRVLISDAFCVFQPHSTEDSAKGTSRVDYRD